jgi:Leucine-rich repeat (LRR) protein
MICLHGTFRLLLLYHASSGKNKRHWPRSRGLKELKSLQALDLAGAQVTDAGLKQLAVLKNLQTLDLGNTKVSDGALKELQKALPGCAISRR